MEQGRFRCAACKKIKSVRVRGQRFCSARSCQHARKNAWRRGKYATDPDYRDNQRRSTQTWLASVGGAAKYHREYRRRKRSRAVDPADQQPGRCKPASSPLSPPLEVEPASPALSTSVASVGAKSDAKVAKSVVKTGRYLLWGVEGTNRDAMLVEIRAIARC